MIEFSQTRAARLDDRDYFDLILASVETAKRRLWVSIFIYDIRPARDLEGKVLDLTTALIERNRLGVDTRVLMTGNVTTPDISVANLASGLYLRAAGVPHRRVFRNSVARSGSHAKLVVSDDVAVVGSQNWTDDGFTDNIEDAVLLTGNAVELIAQEFLSLWDRARGMPRFAAG